MSEPWWFNPLHATIQFHSARHRYIPVHPIPLVLLLNLCNVSHVPQWPDRSDSWNSSIIHFHCFVIPTNCNGSSPGFFASFSSSPSYRKNFRICLSLFRMFFLESELALPLQHFSDMQGFSFVFFLPEFTNCANPVNMFLSEVVFRDFFLFFWFYHFVPESCSW